MGVGRKRVRRLDVWLTDLDPTQGSEIRKTRPCLVISPDDMNGAIRAVIIAPMTTTTKSWPTRIPCTFKGTKGFIVLDQIRTVDVERLSAHLGRISPRTGETVLERLREMFVA